MDRYFVSYMCIYYDSATAESPEEAAEIVANNCPYDVDGLAHVVNLRTNEEFEI